MPLKVYDTRSGKKIALLPQDEKRSIRMFLCGPTVYDYSHAGHARMVLAYDVMARHLRASGAKVSAVVNITDIDPKIFARARQEGVSAGELAGRFIKELQHDMAALGVDGFAWARVSDHVGAAQEAIKRLLQKGAAYGAAGNVYLDVTGTGFGGLAGMSGKEIEDSRLDISEGKRSPSDILLWNGVEHFDVSFDDSVLGSGIPWWHMQDTSVAIANFGGRYDLHGGASELVYPHHESHRAQLRAIAAEDRQREEPVRVWTHTGLVYAKGGEKMSKSLGNVVRIRDLLARHGANAVRLYLLSKHYRKRFDFDESKIAEFEELSAKIAGALAGSDGNEKNKHVGRRRSHFLKDFMRQLDDDLDTPGAIRVMEKALGQRPPGRKELAAMVKVLGLRY